MILKDLTIRGFGRFHDYSISFADGINVVYGSNEAGKSTMHSFIRAMLYGMERGRGRASKTDAWSRYEPWSGSKVYGGSMRCEKDGHIFRIDRDFAKNPKDVTVTDETAGTPVTDTKAFFEDLLSGMGETAYANTVSIGQLKSATDSGMVNELRNYIANMNTTGNMALNISKASAFLKDQKKSFASQMTPEAAKSYAADLTEIRQIEAEISSPEYRNDLNRLKEEKAETLRRHQELQQTKESLIEKISADRQRLKSGGFESREAIRNYQDGLDQSYGALQTAAGKCGKPGRKAGFVCSLILAVLSLGLAAYLFIVGPPNLFTTATGLPWRLTLDISAGLSFVLFAVSIILTEIEACAESRLRKAAQAFSENAGKLAGYGAAADRTTDQADGPEQQKQSADKNVTELLALCDTIDADSARLAETTASIASLESRQEETSAHIEKQQKSQWELEQQLEHLSNLKDEAAALKHAIAENDRLQFEIDAIDLAQETMTRLSASIRDSFGLYLNKRASDLICGITGGIYSSMSIDENLNVFMNTPEKLVPLEQVSSGTMDQVYLALRLAAADLMQTPENPLPLFFDDSFVNYDEDRLRVALKWLAGALSRQVLIFTCHRREAQLLSANLIEYRLSELK